MLQKGIKWHSGIKANVADETGERQKGGIESLRGEKGTESFRLADFFSSLAVYKQNIPATRLH